MSERDDERLISERDESARARQAGGAHPRSLGALVEVDGASASMASSIALMVDRLYMGAGGGGRKPSGGGDGSERVDGGGAAGSERAGAWRTQTQ